MSLLLVKTGSTLPEIAVRRGDFERWFTEGTGGTQLTVVDVRRGEPLPDPASHDGVLVTGSAAMVSDREPWSVRTGEWLARVVATGTPLLAVCYGHQLLAEALGGRAGPNPRGREIGTVEVELGEAARADSLFGSMPPRLCVQATHLESVLELPEGVERLGANALDPYQIFRAGEHAWGVQFHPEFDADIVRGYIAGRRDAIEREGLDPDALIAATRDSDHGRALLRRFTELAT